MSPRRTVGLVVSGALATVAALHSAETHRERAPLPPIPQEVARRGIDGERDVVGRMGMTLAEEGDATVSGGAGAWARDLALRPRECVAVIVGTYGHHTPELIWIDDGAGNPASMSLPALEENPSVHAVGDAAGLVLHVQLCRWTEGNLRVAVRTRAHDTAPVTPTSGALRYAIYRAPWDRVGGMTGLTRGRVTEAGMRALGDEAALAQTARAVPPGETIFGPAVRIGVGATRLVPVSEANHGLLCRSTSAEPGEVVNPRVDVSPVEGEDAWGVTRPLDATWSSVATGRATPEHDAVIETGSNAFKRVLAVVDRAAFGRRCVTLLFTRARYGYLAEVSRFERSPRSLSPLRRVDNVALDTVCPAIGSAIYVVPDDDHEAYRLQVSSADAAPAPAATGPEMGATRDPTPQRELSR